VHCAVYRIKRYTTVRGHRSEPSNNNTRVQSNNRNDPAVGGGYHDEFILSANYATFRNNRRSVAFSLSIIGSLLLTNAYHTNMYTYINTVLYEKISPVPFFVSCI